MKTYKTDHLFLSSKTTYLRRETYLFYDENNYN